MSMIEDNIKFAKWSIKQAIKNIEEAQDYNEYGNEHCLNMAESRTSDTYKYLMNAINHARSKK